MILHDQHVHSYYSFDSSQSIEEYLALAKKLGLSYFILTDHCDLNYLDKGKDLFFDIKKQNLKLERLQKDFSDIKILRGIEIGYKPSEIIRIEKIISLNNFDLINFSLHESDGIDYYFVEEFKKHGIEKTLKNYFQQELEAITNFNNFDVFCHLDYGFKTAYLANNKVKINDYEEDLRKIMCALIKKEKALEINIKVQSVLPLEHTKYILNLYKKLGGKYLTLSSDAHEITMFRYDFDKYLKLIKECGFDSISYFVKRKQKFAKL